MESRSVNEGRFLAALAAFAQVLARGGSVRRSLGELLERVTEILPATSAGALLVMPEEAHRPLLPAATPAAERILRRQVELEEGPGLRAYHEDRHVAVPDLVGDTSFPRFSPSAVAEGFAAVHSVPLRVGTIPVGALDLYGAGPFRLRERERTGVEMLAEVSAAHLWSAMQNGRIHRPELPARPEAFRHPVTGLPDRVLLHDRLEQAVESCRRSSTFVGLLYLDLGGVTGVDVRQGREAGDRLLLAAGERVERALRAGDTLAQLSREELVVVCERLTRRKQAEDVAERLLLRLDRPFRSGGVSVALRPRIGIAFCGPGPGHGSPARALAYADDGRHRAGRRGDGGRITVLC